MSLHCTYLVVHFDCLFVINSNREWQQMREEGHVIATGLDAALEGLSVDSKEDKHPEKRAKVNPQYFPNEL